MQKFKKDREVRGRCFSRANNKIRWHNNRKKACFCDENEITEVVEIEKLRKQENETSDKYCHAHEIAIQSRTDQMCLYELQVNKSKF